MIRIACAQLHLTKDMEENYHKALLYLQQFIAFKPLAHRPKPMLAKP